MTESLNELEREVEAARARLDGTIEAIQGRLTLSGIVDEVMGSLNKRQVSSGFDSAVSLAKRNPLPLMIVAAGVGWLIHRSMGGQDGSRSRLALSSTEEPDLPLLNTGHARVYDPDSSTRHPAQDSLESRRDLTAHA